MNDDRQQEICGCENFDEHGVAQKFSFLLVLALLDLSGNGDIVSIFLPALRTLGCDRIWIERNINVQGDVHSFQKSQT